MPNPLFEQLNRQPQTNPMAQKLAEFRRTFSGNPQQTVQNLLNTGRITQDQVNQYARQADEIYKQLRGII